MADQGDIWMFDYLQDYVSLDTLNAIHHHLLAPHSPAQALKRQALVHGKRAADALGVVLVPLGDRLLGLLQRSPDLVVVLFAGLVLLLVLQVLSWLRRLVVWWTRLAFRAALWAALVALAAVAWQRGLEATARDVVVVGAKLWGWAAAVKDIWLDEYFKHDAARQSRAVPGPGPGPAGYGRGRGGGGR